MKRYLFMVILAFSLFALISWKPRYVNVKPEDGKVKIAVTEVNDGIPHYYRISLDKEIRFFLLMSNDGVVRAAFDACDVCYPFNKGYGYEGDFVICNNCGRRFHESQINIIQGGCNPAPVERTYDKAYVYITADTLRKGANYF